MINQQVSYKKLFLITVSISAVTFGGGYVIVPLMRQKLVTELRWIKESEMLDMIAIAQSAPGPIAINTAIITGYRLKGVGGAAAAVLGAILPPFLILSVITPFYSIVRENKVVAGALLGMQAGVAAVIINVVYEIGKKQVGSIFSLAIGLTVFFASLFFHWNVAWLLLGCGLMGWIYCLIQKKKGV